ncbi:hypothetical protein OHB01_12905 [Microbispora hainanensis]|uniref:hypothetical protein n=1 Tax=Microbispora hainanensis TaxID=568844 RepID=UPI002E2AAE7D|nr:hypothetical protein [Microbispora hainanensis]
MPLVSRRLRTFVATSMLVAAATLAPGGGTLAAYATSSIDPLWNSGLSSQYLNLMADDRGVTIQTRLAVYGEDQTVYQRFDADGQLSSTITDNADYSDSAADSAGNIFEIRSVPTGGEQSSRPVDHEFLSSCW